MNRDILPPPQPPRPTTSSQSAAPHSTPSLPPLVDAPALAVAPKKRSHKKWIIGSIVILLLVAVVSAYVWYRAELRPVDGHNTAKQRIEIKPGMTARGVAAMLQQKRLIRSSDAFYLYTYLHGQRDHIEAGVYSVAPSDSTAQVVDRLTSGKIEQFSVTFYPGGTLYDLRTNQKSSASDVTSMLEQAGYSEAAITVALKKTYTSPLFAGKPSGTSLEGYVYGDTYAFDANASASDVLERTFAEFNTVVKQNDLVALYQKQGLNLYQGITLASIIQREVASSSDKKTTKDQAIVAQIFLTRLKGNTTLGSDVTYQYAAAMRGVAPSPNLDSPYNTRKYPGLPPGPISSPGLGALLAVAHPAATDYNFFLSGDDGKTYFAHTDAEHQANIAAHCQQKCSVN